MKKTIITLMALAGVTVAADVTDSWIYSTNGTYDGTEGAQYAGLNFTIEESPSTRISTEINPTDAVLTSKVALDTITLTTRGNQDVTGTFNMYVVDAKGTLMAVASNSITLDTNNVATKMEFSFITASNYGTNQALTVENKYFAYLLSSDYMDEKWTNYSVGKTTISGSDINSIQLACYGYGNDANQEEWGCAGKDRAALYPNFAPVASVTFHTIPEPTTATLSLLALAGLAARRRRK